MNEILIKFSIIFVLFFLIVFLVYFVFTRPEKFIKSKKNKIKLIETFHLDNKKKIVLLSCKEKEYLILLSQSSNMMIDTFKNNEIITDDIKIPNLKNKSVDNAQTNIGNGMIR